MSQQLRFQGIEGDMCNCGRRKSIRHCTSCGSARIYAYAHPEYYTNLAGDVELVSQLYRCLGCGHRFVDAERIFCEAPPFGIEDAKRKIRVLAEAKARGEYLRPQEAEAANVITELLDKETQPTVASSSTTSSSVESILTEQPPERPIDPVIDKAIAEAKKIVASSGKKLTPIEIVNSVRPEGIRDVDWQETRAAIIAEWATWRGVLNNIELKEYAVRKLNGENFNIT